MSLELESQEQPYPHWLLVLSKKKSPELFVTTLRVTQAPPPPPAAQLLEKLEGV